MSAMARPVRRLDEVVRVEKIKMQLLGDQPANRGFARAHEADEREVDELAAVLHGDGLAENGGGRTPKSCPLDSPADFC